MFSINLRLILLAMVFAVSSVVAPGADWLQSASAQRVKSARGNLKFQRSKTALPQAVLQQKKVQPRNLRAVQPPRSSRFYGRGTIEAEYERLVDEQIRQTYQLSLRYKRSRNRGEIWLRMGELYIEKARLIEFRKLDEYDKRMEAYRAKKISTQPRLDLKETETYHRKAIQLYEWFVRDFPKDEKVDQALYFLGYTNFEIGNTKKGERYYQQLVANFPRSMYVTESYFALGDFYFENDRWAEALKHFNRVLQNRRARLYTFALYKAAWCLFRLGQVEASLKSLERVVVLSRTAEQKVEAGTSSVNQIRLASEALKDYVPFYAESKRYQSAEADFLRVAGKDSLAEKMLSQLAYFYSDSGNNEGARFLFKRLIAKDPYSTKAAEYQYQIVLVFSNMGDNKTFKQELFDWITQFGPESRWAQAHSKDTKLIQDTYKLQETTLRNHILKLHQTAQKTGATYTQKEAAIGYVLYLKYFGAAPEYAQMRYFYADLLFDMKEYDQASEQYLWYMKNHPKGEFFETATINNVLALEHKLPTAEEIDARRKTLASETDKLPFDTHTAKFVQAARIYLAQFPNGEKAPEVRRRLGNLYYQHNYFPEALAIFNDVLARPVWDKDSQVAAELTLDIYKLTGDMAKFQDVSQRFLKNPNIAKSAFGKQLEENLQKSALLNADQLSKKGNHLKSAKAFESFARENPSSPQAVPSLFNAANNYEKGGDVFSAIRMYGVFLQTPAKGKAVDQLKKDAHNSRAALFRKTGQLEEAAAEYYAYARTETGQKRTNALFNAAIIWDALNDYDKARRAYLEYFESTRDHERNDAYYFIAEMDLRRNQLRPAQANYEKYISLNPGDGEKLVRSHYMVADIASKTGQVTKSKEWYKKTFSVYDALKNAGKPAGVRYAAEARFLLSLGPLNEMRTVKLGTTETQIMKGLERLKQLQKSMLEQMVPVIRYDYGPYVVAAVASEAQAYEIIAHAFETSPVPKEYATGEQAQQFRDLAANEAKGFREKAKGVYQNAFEKALQLEAYSEWTLSTKRGLSKYEPKLAPPGGEQVNGPFATDMMERGR